MRGMSSGAIVAVAIAVVVLIVALVALVFVFHSNNSSAGSKASNTQQGALGQIFNTSTGSIKPCTQQIVSVGHPFINLTTNQVTIYVDLYNPCNTAPTITSVAVVGVPVTLNSITDVVNKTTYTGTQPGQIHILTGDNYLTISGTPQQTLGLQSGVSVPVQITLSNGQTVTVVAMIKS